MMTRDEVQELIERGIGFRRGDVVVLESQVPLQQSDMETFSMFSDAVHQTTGVRFVLLAENMKVSEVHRNSVRLAEVERLLADCVNGWRKSDDVVGPMRRASEYLNRV